MPQKESVGRQNVAMNKLATREAKN